MAPTQLHLGPEDGTADPDMSGARAWILTDGKAGDETQCLAVAEALGLAPEIRRVAPRPPFIWLMPWGPVDPREGVRRAGSPIAPPSPDLLIASGRRAVPYVRAVKRGSGGRTFTVFLKDPRTGPGSADLIWAPSYDRLRGPNVVTSLTSPHRFSPERLAAERLRPDPRVAGLNTPRAAVLVGGGSRHHRFAAGDIARFTAQLRSLAGEGASLMITTSRRTPPPLAAVLRGLAAESGGLFWDGAGPNPYGSMLALAEAIVVTADSVNMLSEALATGAPVLVFEPDGGGGRLGRFLDELKLMGVIKSFGGKLERYTYEKLDSTPVIAQAVARGFAAHRAAIGAAVTR